MTHEVIAIDGDETLVIYQGTKADCDAYADDAPTYAAYLHMNGFQVREIVS